MLKKKVILSLSTALLLASGAGFAATGKSATGFYAGIHGGYGFGQAKYSNKEAVIKNTSQSNFSPKGVVGGLHVGYQKEFGNFVPGLELFWGLSGRKDSSQSNVDLGGGVIAKTTNSVKEKYYYGLAARFGFKINDTVIPYVKLGYQRAKYAYVDSVKAGAFERKFSKSKVLGGFAPGVGVDVMLTSNVMLGLEYTHAFYGKLSGARKDKSRMSLKPSASTVALRLSYKF